MADAPSSTSDRQHRRAEFVRSAGWGDATERLLAGDASFRKYFRLHRGATTVVVMDSPAAHEPVEPFVRIGRHLRALGLSAPEILAADLAQGFLLLEDLGDDTFARVLARGANKGGDEIELYERATDVLVAGRGRVSHSNLTATARNAISTSRPSIPRERILDVA